MHNWKWVNLSKMAGLNVSLSLNEKQSSSDKKHNKSLRLFLFIPFRWSFAGSLAFSSSTVKQTTLFHSISEMLFTYLARKTLWVKLFSLNVCDGALQAAIKGGNFGAKLTHLSGFWLDVSFFSHVKKHRSRFWLDESFFFKCETIVRSSDWLELISVRKLYLRHSFFVSISQYVYNKYK